ncbi:MAG: AMP-binding protein [Solirubrobacterales bacterium]|nr:AMP-binding protein [Solirubrobacterales bacterium]MBV9717232.1 AMP-binding protein [Solirubrobacterales bacterium]
MIRSPLPDVEIPDVSLTEFVLARAAELGDRLAFIDASNGAATTYAELAQSVRAVAAGLAERGFVKGDVFAHYAPNLPEYAVAFHAVATVGGVNTTANPLLTAGELGAQLRDSGARLLVTVPELLEKATAAAQQASVEEILVYGEADGATPFTSLRRAAGEPPAVSINSAEDLVALPYSSGTTGLPKGVMLTHRNLVANICQTIAHQRVHEDDRVIAVLPFFHIYGLVVLMNLPLYRGATVVTMPRFVLADFLRAIQDYRITRAWVVPPIVLALVKDPLVDEFDVSSLEFVLSGAAPLSAELEVACGKRLGCRTLQGYGLTETSPTTHSVPDDLAGQMAGSIGPPLPNTECRVVDMSTGQDAADGQAGELLIRGPQVMKGYFNNPRASAQAIDPDGWLHTGDVARVEPDGSTRIVDRVKELIKYKAYQIAPAELEALLLTHPMITDAAVIPIPDEEAGEVPKAFVVSTGSITAEEVGRFVAEHVAPYKKVRAVELVEQIPKAASGKILRRVLIERERTAAVAG